MSQILFVYKLNFFLVGTRPNSTLLEKLSLTFVNKINQLNGIDNTFPSISNTSSAHPVQIN